MVRVEGEWGGIEGGGKGEGEIEGWEGLGEGGGEMGWERLEKEMWGGGAWGGWRAHLWSLPAPQ